jgi:hypothetical protein
MLGYGQMISDARFHALFWSASNVVTDLHVLLEPSLGFFSTRATNTWSDANFTYVVGYGNFSRGGQSGEEAILWTKAIPTPTSAGVAGVWLGLIALRRRR